MKNADIRAALINTIRDGGITTPIQWEGAAFSVPNNSPWLRFTPFFMARTSRGLSETDEQPVMVQIDVFTPKGSDNRVGVSLADSIAALFPRNTRINFTGGFMQVISVSCRPSPDDRYVRQIVEIDLTAYGQRNG